MKLWRKTTEVGVSVLAALCIGFTGLYQVAHAATGTLYVSLTKTSAQKGDAVSANIRINPGTAVDTVMATVTYNASQLSYKGISYGGSPFSTQIPGNVTSGSVTFSSAYLGGSVSSDSFVARLDFTVAASSGTATVGVSGNAARNGTATNPAVTGDSMTITQLPQTCPVGQIGTPPNCHTPVCPTGQVGTYPDCHDPVCPTGQVGTYPDCHSPACPVGQIGTPPNCHAITCPKNTTGTYPHCTPIDSGTSKPPTNGGSSSGSTGGSNSGSNSGDNESNSGSSNVAVKSVQVQYTVADMIITTKGKSQVYIQYGLKRDSLNTQTKMSGWGTVHKIEFRPTTILPGQTYFYQIVAKDSNGNTTKSTIDNFDTKGITIKIGVYDKAHHPIKNKKVTLHSTPQTANTDDEGFVTFTNVAPGSHTVTYEAGSKTYTQPLVVSDNIHLVGDVQEADPQNFSIVYNLEQSAGIPYTTIGVVLAGILALTVVVAIIKKRHSGGGIYYSGGSGMGGGDPVYGQVTVGGPSQPQSSGAVYPPQDNRSLADRLESIPQPQQTTPGTVIASEGPRTDDITTQNY